MASYPARRHTRRGIALTLAAPLEHPAGPDPGCGCDACERYFEAREPNVSYQDLTNGAQ